MAADYTNERPGISPEAFDASVRQCERVAARVIICESVKVAKRPYAVVASGQGDMNTSHFFVFIQTSSSERINWC